MTNLQAFYREVRERLAWSGIENADLEARVFLKRALSVSDADLIGGDGGAVTGEAAQQINSWLTRRLTGEPLSRILGTREFWSLPFRVTPDVLDPRPDTETLVEAALKIFAGNPPARILDLGTGSGCILIALLHEWQNTRGTGVDKSPAALAIAAENAATNNVASRAEFIQGGWTAGEGPFDLLVSNPPYIPTADIPTLESAVKNHDPILALDGGRDGLQAYIAILAAAKDRLAPGGVILFEVGQGQAEDVMRLGANAGFTGLAIHRDLAGIQRVVEMHFGDK